ncbi:MAG TPA: methyltransferase [Prevotellaceae bacterium]|nr:methyltransferase [Prevotellaceae bacterium]
MDLEDYILSHIDEENPYMARLYRETNIYLVRSHMASGHLQGCFLRMVVQMIRPHRILEIGTYTGYSALCMASALTDNGKIVTYEINDELEDFTRTRLEQSPWAEHIEFRIGDVLKDLDKSERFDMIFIDGNKRQYKEYYEMSLNVLEDGGFILADNTLWDGHVVDSEYDNDAQTQGICAFNDFVAQDKRVEKVILPLRDGMTLIRVKPKWQQPLAN